MSAKRKEAGANAQGRFAYEGLDRAIHEKARLGILASLSTHRGGVSFNDLKQLCSLTDGNLNRHLAVLLDAEFVRADHASGRRRQVSVYTITAKGRARFLEYIRVLEAVVADAAQADRATAERGTTRKLNASPSPA